MDRRGFLGAMLAAGVAPAFIKADRLMKLVVPSEVLIVPQMELISDLDSLLITPSFITREALKILERNVELNKSINARFELNDSQNFYRLTNDKVPDIQGQREYEKKALELFNGITSRMKT